MNLHVNVLVATGVDNPVRQLVDAVADGVVVAVLVVVAHLGFLVGVSETEWLNGFVVDSYVLFARSVAGLSVYGVLVDADVLSIAATGTESIAVFSFSVINSAGVWLAVSINFDVSVGELCACRSVLLSYVVLRVETGTAAIVFFTGKTDSFLVVLVRRVLAFPSGWLL